MRASAVERIQQILEVWKKLLTFSGFQDGMILENWTVGSKVKRFLKLNLQNCSKMS